MQNESKNQLIPVFNTSHSIDYNLDSISDILHKPTAQKIINSWENGTLVDNIGQVWIISDFLAQIWRTDNSTAYFLLRYISPKDRANFGEYDCIKYSAVVYMLSELIQRPISHKRREYLRVSEKIGIKVRDSDPVEVIRFKYKEFIEETKKRLKQQRIKEFNISFDELTGETLNKSAEFHHIRRQSIYPNMISLLWNGVIINKETHDIITARDISDEYDLKNLCNDMGWSIEWVDFYEECLDRYGF